MKTFRLRSVLLSALPILLTVGLSELNRAIAQGFTGTVTGHVVCADTGAPARFARVVLKSAKPSHAGQDMMQGMINTLQKAAAQQGDDSISPPNTPERKKQITSAESGVNQIMEMMGATSASLDGSYKVFRVAPGTYYVRVIYPGYVDPVGSVTDDDLASTDPAVVARLAALPKVTITGGEPIRADIRLERGAAITGRILYGDGSPANGWTVTAVPAGESDDAYDPTIAAVGPSMAMAGAGTVIKSDDEGRYRIAGLPAGEYHVHATVTAMPAGVSAANSADGGNGIILTVYAGDSFTVSGARSMKLPAGSEINGVDIHVPERRLHDIAGKVVAKGDGHALNFGNVLLTSKRIPSLHLLAAIHEDGSFRFEYLPAGFTYTVATQGAADAKRGTGKMSMLGINILDNQILRKYTVESAEVALSDTDVSSVQLSPAQTDWKPTPPKPGDKQITPGALIDGLLGTDVNSNQGK